MSYLIAFGFVLYLILGYVSLRTIKSLKPDMYAEQWLKSNDTLAMMGKPLNPSVTKKIYDVNVILLFPVTLFEYFVKKPKVKVKRFNHKAPKRKANVKNKR